MMNCLKYVRLSLTGTCAFFGAIAAFGAQPPSGDYRLPDKAVVVECSPGYNSWPMIQVVGKRLVCGYSRGSGHSTGEGRRNAYVRHSDDGGLTWSPETTLAADPKVGECNEGAGLDSTGAGLFWVRSGRGGWSNCRHDLYRTTDGVTFEKIASPELKPWPIQVMDPVRVDGLGLVSPWFAGDYRKGAHANSWGILVSADDGRTWEQRTVERDLAVVDWVTEPSLVDLGRGRLLIVSRCEQGLGTQFQVTSADGGRTWTKRRTNIGDVRESTPSLIYDAATDRLDLYYYHRGARQLKRRTTTAAAIWSAPTAWPEPEILDRGYERRAWDAGNVKATRLGGKDVCAWYTGSPSNAAIVVTFAPRGDGEMATPESQGISSQAVLNWIEACEREVEELHGFVIRRHGQVIAAGSWAPYDTLREPHRLYSHSKSFTSTAVGFLVDEGRLDLDERVIDILPDKAPANPCDNLKALRVRDLLTMNVGAKHGDAEARDRDGDWERAFLGNTFELPPGTKYMYDSGATYLCAAIVCRRSGRDMMDLLRERLFEPLGMTSPRTTRSPSGTPCGGWGMDMTTGDLAKFGQLFLDRGLWRGRRIISAEWVDLATARQTWSGAIAVTGQDGSDWHQGYGFQFWRCRHGAYRADGANGQFTIVLPKEDAVVSLHAGAGNTQRELDEVWTHLLPAFRPAPLAEDAASLARLRAKCAALALKPVAGGKEGAEKFCGFDYRFEANKYNLKTLRLDPLDGGWQLTLTSDEVGAQRFPVGFGEWKRGSVLLRKPPHEPLGLFSGVQRVAASAAVQPGGWMRLRAPILDGPQRFLLDFALGTNGVPRVTGQIWGICGTKLTAWSFPAPAKGRR